MHPGLVDVAQATQVFVDESLAYPVAQFPLSHFPAPVELQAVEAEQSAWHFPQVPEVFAVLKPYPTEQASQAPLFAQVLQLSTQHPLPHNLVVLLYLYPVTHEVESQNPAPFVGQAEQLSAYFKQVLLLKVL